MEMVIIVIVMILFIKFICKTRSFDGHCVDFSCFYFCDRNYNYSILAEIHGTVQGETVFSFASIIASTLIAINYHTMSLLLLLWWLVIYIYNSVIDILSLFSRIWFIKGL